MKRWLVRIFVLLMLGAIVNVAVAWGCAICAGETAAMLLEDANIDSMLLASVADDGERFHHRSGTDGSGPGVRRVVVAAIGQDGNRFYGHHSVWAGLPIRAMSGELAIASSNLESPWHSAWAIELSPGLQQAIYGFAPGILPLRPIWPGFAISTMFYAAIVWGLFATPFALRRRWRKSRGLCPKCAYPIGTSGTCTECGEAVIGVRMNLHASITNGFTGIATTYSLEDSQQINEAELAALLDQSSESQHKGAEQGVGCDVSLYTITAHSASRKWTIEFDETSISEKSQDLLRWIERHCKRA